MIAAVAFATLSLLGAGAPARSNGLPIGWRQVSVPPDGGDVYHGRRPLPASERRQFWRATLPSALVCAGAALAPPTTTAPPSAN